MWFVEAPEVVAVDRSVARAIADRHGLVGVDGANLLDSSGMINTVYALGDPYVPRVPRRHPGHVEQAVREAAPIPLVVAAGVRTPGLVAFDATCELVPVPDLLRGSP